MADDSRRAKGRGLEVARGQQSTPGKGYTVTASQVFKIMRAADSYAKVAVRVHTAKTKARLTGDSIRALDRQREAARERFFNLLQDIASKTEGV